MSRICLTVLRLTAAIILLPSTGTEAGLILQPFSASTDIQTSPLSSPDNVRSQSGLSANYTSLVSNFDHYIATNPTHQFSSQSDIWNGYNGGSGPPPFPGNFDFDLGGLFAIQSLALWNFGGNQDANLVGFTLLADDNHAFSSPVTLGSYTANPNTGDLSAVRAEVFGFAPVNASFVRMRITSNHGDPANVVFGEVAFEALPIPEPSSLILLSFGALGLVGPGFRRHHRIREASAAEASARGESYTAV